MNALTISSAVFGSTSFLLGVLVPFFGKKDIHKIVSLFNILVSMWGLSLFMLSISGNSLEKARYWWNAGNAVGLLLAPVFCHFVITLCRHPRKSLWFVYSCSAAYFILTIFGAMDFNLRYVFDSFYYPTAHDLLYHTEAFFWIFCVVYGHIILFRSYKSAGDELKIQIKYLFIAFFIGFTSGGLTHWLLVYGVNIHPAWNIFITAYSLLFTYAIFRHKLLGIDFAIRKGLVYSLLISISTGLYFISIVVIEKIFQQSFGYQPVYSLIVIAIVILTAEPLRIKIQHFIDYSFFKGSLPAVSHERELLQYKIQDQDKMKAVATLAAGMAHEIKNPLTAIKTFAEYLPHKASDPDFLNRFSIIVSSEVNKIDVIVKQLLEFSKPSAPKFESLNLAKIIEDTLRLLDAEFIKHRIDVTVKQGECGATIIGDTKQLQQAFLNLILNSIQAMPDGGKLGLKILDGFQQGTRLLISDTGYGISRENLSHIFDPFFTTKESGTGLGLAITHGILRKHGCKIHVQSNEKSGTCFDIVFPLSSVKIL